MDDNCALFMPWRCDAAPSSVQEEEAIPGSRAFSAGKQSHKASTVTHASQRLLLNFLLALHRVLGKACVAALWSYETVQTSSLIVKMPNPSKSVPDSFVRVFALEQKADANLASNLMACC